MYSESLRAPKSSQPRAPRKLDPLLPTGLSQGYLISALLCAAMGTNSLGNRTIHHQCLLSIVFNQPGCAPPGRLPKGCWLASPKASESPESPQPVSKLRSADFGLCHLRSGASGVLMQRQLQRSRGTVPDCLPRATETEASAGKRAREQFSEGWMLWLSTWEMLPHVLLPFEAQGQGTHGPGLGTERTLQTFPERSCPPVSVLERVGSSPWWLSSLCHVLAQGTKRGGEAKRGK